MRVAKKDVEVRLQNQLLYNHDLKIKYDKSKQTTENDFKTIKQTQEQLEALESELVMQESINENKIRDIQINLNHQIDEINQTKEVEMESLKSRYADLFNEKAQESEILRSEFGDSQVKIQQQSRTISDLEFKEKELNDLLSKKQKCHHKEFDRTHSELQSEIEFLREISMKSETELRLLETKFAEFKDKLYDVITQSRYMVHHVFREGDLLFMDQLTTSHRRSAVKNKDRQLWRTAFDYSEAVDNYKPVIFK